MQRTSNISVHKIIEYRPYSPARSPMRSTQRPISPIRNSPFSRQAPMSPLRARKLDKSSTTPTKSRACRDQFMRSPKNNQYHTQYAESHVLDRRAIKSGVGLFQQLVNEHKIGSERKENRYVSHCVTPFELGDRADRKKQQERKIDDRGSYGLIQNHKQDQSVKTLKPSFNNSQTISKADNKLSHMQSTVKIQCGNPMKQHINILDSFGAPKYSQNTENSAFSKLAAKICQLAVSVNNQQEQCQVQPNNNERSAEQQPSPISSFAQKQKPAVGSSYEDIILLIKRAGEYRKQDSSLVSEQLVKNSLKLHDISFNMNPFI